MATLHIKDDLRDFAEAEAAKCGLSGADAFVEFLLIDAKHRANGDGARTSSAPARDAVATAIDELERLRIGNRLDGLSIRQLIEEGRRL